jgi:hypothetical protein
MNLKMEVCELELSGSELDQVTRSCEYSIATARSIKCREFLDLVRNYYLLKSDSAPWRWLVDYSLM